MSVSFESPNNLVLLAIADGPKHGLAVQQRVIGDTVGNYIPNMTICHSLKALVSLGMAEVRPSGRRLVYEITDKGRYRLEMASREKRETSKLAQQRLRYS